VAAFEIEGHYVNGSINKNAQSLCAAAEAGAKVLAMVLFQIGPDGKLWYPFSNSAKGRKYDRAEMLKQLLPKDYVDQVKTVHDVDLFGKLEEWEKKLMSDE
jgi:hypothetical protein